MPIDDATLLAKYKLAGVSNERIAAKLGITVAEVQLRWERMVEAAKNAPTSANLVAQVGVLAVHYQMLGDVLRTISNALGNIMPPEEVQALVSGSPEQNVVNLTKHAIVLRPFYPVEPQAAREETVKQN